MGRGSNRGRMPVFRWFNDRPKPDAVRAYVYWQNVHAFLFHWGVTVRWRRPGNKWQHATMFLKARPRDSGRGGSLSIGTWQTSDGVTERVPKSKRYVMLKVLG